MPATAEIDLPRALTQRIDALRAYVNDKIPDRLRVTISADDILQEIWVSANQNLAEFRPEGANAMDRWLTTIANSRLVDALRAARALKRGGGSRHVRDADRRMRSFCALFGRLRSPGRTPSREVRTVEAAHVVRISLASLPGDVRRAVELRYVEELPCRDIAERMGKTERAIHSLLFRGLRQLRMMVGDAERLLSA